MFKSALKDVAPSVYREVNSVQSFQELETGFYPYMATYPWPFRNDQPCAFLGEITSKAVDAFVGLFVPPTQEKAKTWDTGVHIEAIMIKGSVKEKEMTSLGAAGVEWKLFHFYYIPSQ